MSRSFQSHPIHLAILLLAAGPVLAQGSPEDDARTLAPVKVQASADASAQGLQPAYPGGQVARGGRVGVLGQRDNMETPFSVTSYTNELIQDRQARSVGEVLQNDPGVRMARGFGNFQESYFIRGFILGSDDVAYNGLYSLLPRQYIATELFERVELLRGASTFLNGVTPGNGGLGGAINLLPKRAPNEPLTRFTTGISGRGQASLAADVARRFGPDDRLGVRVNVAHRDGETAIADEKSKLSLVSLGVDWRSRDVRLSADLGWQDNQLKQTRPNVTLSSAVSSVPRAPDASANFAQPWSFSNERDLFGTLRGEIDLSADLTAYAAYGLRRSDEANALANLSVSNGSTGAGSTYRFDNTREDKVNTGEIGLRGKLRTGSVGHEWVLSGSYFELEKKNAYAMDLRNTLATNLYTPSSYALPAFSANTLYGNRLASPALNGVTRLVSYAIGDTLSLLDDRLLVTAGLRHQQIYARSYAYDTGVAGKAYDDSRASPILGAVYKLDRRVSVYANYIEGLVQGDTAPTSSGGTAVRNAGDMLSPYVSRQKEVGVKFDTGRLGMGLALFSIGRPRSVLTSDARYVAEGKDRHQGLEFTVFGEATRGLRVLGGLTLLDAEQQETGSATTDGKRVIGVPRQQANLGLEWDVPGVRGLAVDGRVVHTGATYANATNSLKVDAWTRLDVGARYLMEVSSTPVTLRARIDNLMDKNYWASVGGYPGSGYLVASGPRTLALSASVDF